MRQPDTADSRRRSSGAIEAALEASEQLLGLERQAACLSTVALLSVTAPAQARCQLLRELPLRGVHPSLVWVWHIVLHHCGQRMHALAEREIARLCRHGGRDERR